ncbi:MAG: TetR/AcrR family transcriptional regulator [Syntrophales bacterium]|nr:TetR/AcrR family transcriptional regulator [Syntrophales bacterium]
MLGPESRREREKGQRRQVVLMAAKKLFIENGFKAVTVASIAEKAELSKGAIYLYFSSKEEIYAQILLNDVELFHEKISQIFQEGKPAADMLLDFANAYINIFMKEREQFRIMMHFALQADNLSLSSEVRRQIVGEMNRMISLIEKILQYGISTGELLLKKPAIKNMKNALWGLLNGIISLHLFVGAESMREERIRSDVKEGIKTMIAGLKNKQEVAGHE